MYFKYIRASGISWPVTAEGLIVNSGINNISDWHWLHSLELATRAYACLHPLICYIQSSGAEIKDWNDALPHASQVIEKIGAEQQWWQLAAWVLESVDLPDDLLFLSAAVKAYSSSWPLGYVYLVQSDDEKFAYKIGRTENPKRRIHQLSKANGKVNLIHLIPCQNSGAVERTLHIRFKDKQISGEWFALNSEDVASIKSIEQVQGQVHG